MVMADERADDGELGAFWDLHAQPPVRRSKMSSQDAGRRSRPQRDPQMGQGSTRGGPPKEGWGSRGLEDDPLRRYALHLKPPDLGAGSIGRTPRSST